MLFIYSSTTIANGLGELKVQLISNSIAAIIKIPLAIVFSSYFSFWIVLVIVNILIMLPLFFWQPYVIRRRLADVLISTS